MIVNFVNVLGLGPILFLVLASCCSSAPVLPTASAVAGGGSSDLSSSSYIGSNEENVGLGMAKGVRDLLGNSGKIAVSTVPAQDNLNDRIAGLEKGLEGTDIKIVATGDNKGDDSVTAASTSAILLANPDLDAIVCINATGSGVAAALKETGKVGKVIAVIADRLAPILDAVED